MRLLLQVLEWVRAALLGSPMPGELTHVSAPTPDAHQPVHYPPPQEWARVLQWARHHRAPHLWPSAPPVVAMDIGGGSPVRFYAMPPQERQLALSGQVQP